MEDDRAIAKSSLLSEQQSARQLGIAGMGADREDRPRGSRALPAHRSRRNCAAEIAERHSPQDASNVRGHDPTVALSPAGARFVRHDTQMIDAPNET